MQGANDCFSDTSVVENHGKSIPLFQWSLHFLALCQWIRWISQVAICTALPRSMTWSSDHSDPVEMPSELLAQIPETPMLGHENYINNHLGRLSTSSPDRNGSHQWVIVL